MVTCATYCRELLERGVGLSDLQRSLPTPAILWFCDHSEKSTSEGQDAHAAQDYLTEVVGSILSSSAGTNRCETVTPGQLLEKGFAKLLGKSHRLLLQVIPLHKW